MKPKPYTGPPATLGTMLDAGLIFWGDCLSCGRWVRIETPALEGLAKKYGHQMPMLRLQRHLVCKDCGGRLNMQVNVPGLSQFGGKPRS